MNRRMLPLLLVVLGCRSHSGAEHGSEEEHGHGHGEGAIAITQWGKHAELFAEYAPLVLGNPSETAVHATDLVGFTPVTVGTLTIELTQSDGTVVSAVADKPARPGIFTPPITPSKAGDCQLAMVVTSGTWTERFEADSCVVHAEPPAHEEEEEDSGISFLKEQQWEVDFATVEVQERGLRGTVNVSAEVKPVSGGEAHLTAAVAGRVQFGAQLPVLGVPVAKGQLLATISPPLDGASNRASLHADVVSGRAELDAAVSDKKRVDSLASLDAVPEKRVQEAAAREAVARSRLRAATERLGQYDASSSGRGRGSNSFRILSPIDGTLVSVDVTSGETVQSGHHMFTVIDMKKVWIEGRVFEPDIPAVLAAKEASFVVEGYKKPFEINESNGRVVTVGSVIEPHSRTVPIVFEVDNSQGLLRIGHFAKLAIVTGEPQTLLAVPTSAVLSDGGRMVVFVQDSGETFLRRVVRTGLESGGWIAVSSGVAKGERVVSVGAHIVKLASAASSAPAHGHAH